MKIIEIIEKGNDGLYSIYLPDYNVFKSDFEFDYRYDLSGFFMTYNFFDVSALAIKIGLNASLLRRYKSGASKAENKQKEKIEHGIHNLAKELMAVRF